MDLDLLLLAGLYLLAVLVSVAFLFQRYRWRRRRRLGQSNWGYFPTATSLGNALQTLSVFAQPEVRYVLEEKQSDDEQDDAEGGPEDPTAHLLKQAAKVRRGEKLERITARWKQQR